MSTNDIGVTMAEQNLANVTEYVYLRQSTKLGMKNQVAKAQNSLENKN